LCKYCSASSQPPPAGRAVSHSTPSLRFHSAHAAMSSSTPLSAAVLNRHMDHAHIPAGAWLPKESGVPHDMQINWAHFKTPFRRSTKYFYSCWAGCKSSIWIYNGNHLSLCLVELILPRFEHSLCISLYFCTGRVSQHPLVITSEFTYSHSVLPVFYTHTLQLTISLWSACTHTHTHTHTHLYMWFRETCRGKMVFIQ